MAIRQLDRGHHRPWDQRSPRPWMDGPWVRAAIPAGLWSATIAVAHLWGSAVAESDRRSRIFAAPLVGRIDPQWSGWRILPAVILAGAVVLWGPRMARRWPLPRLLWASGGVAAAWAVSLSFLDGPTNLYGPLTTRWDYLHDLPLVGAPASFLTHFVARASTFSTHVRAHPPGMLLILRALAAAGLSDPRWEAALVIGGGAAAVPAVLLALRHVAGEDRARGAAPFLVLAPAALWIATSADALFAGVSAWGAALIILAIGRRDRVGEAEGLGGGLLFGAALFLSYGVVLVAAIPLGVAAWRRRRRPLAVAAMGVALVVAAFAVAGFTWWAGFASARAAYLAGAAGYRPLAYFWFGDLAAFALVIGPAGFAGLGRLRSLKAWILPGAALVALAVADLSGMSKGEVERIWLPFAPWVLLATASLEEGAGPWLAVQAATALALQVVVRSPW